MSPCQLRSGKGKPGESSWERAGGKAVPPDCSLLGFSVWENVKFQFPGISLIFFGETGGLGLRADLQITVSKEVRNESPKTTVEIDEFRNVSSQNMKSIFPLPLSCRFLL